MPKASINNDKNHQANSYTSLLSSLLIEIHSSLPSRVTAASLRSTLLKPMSPATHPPPDALKFVVSEHKSMDQESSREESIPLDKKRMLLFWYLAALRRVMSLADLRVLCAGNLHRRPANTGNLQLG